MKQSLITLSESKRLVELESAIARGRDAWKVAGNALIEIRDRQLYRADYGSFWEYCEQKWGWKKRNVNTVIGTVEVFNALPEKVSKILPATPSASTIRELSKVEPEKRTEVIEAASSKAESESRPMTARDIREAADPDPEPEPEPEPELVSPPGPSVARQFFAAKIEEDIEAALNGSVEQMQAAKLVCEVGAKKLAAAIREAS